MKRLTMMIALILFPALAHAFPGEVFKIETTGTQYCGDFVSQKVTAKNNTDIWARLDSETLLTLSFTPGFEPGTTFPMTGRFYLTKSTSAAFVGGVIFTDGSYATIRGAAGINKKTGEVTALSGVFIQNGLVYRDCFSSGNFTSKKLP